MVIEKADKNTTIRREGRDELLWSFFSGTSYPSDHVVYIFCPGVMGKKLRESPHMHRKSNTEAILIAHSVQK